MPAIGNRTIVHGLVTAILGLGYAAVVIVLAAQLAFVGGGSGLAVAVATLVVAGLLRPAWRRVQDAENRRFNRRVSAG